MYENLALIATFVLVYSAVAGAVVGDERVVAVAVELPPVKGTDDFTALDASTVPQVRTEMRTIGVHHVGLTVRPTPHHQIATQIPNGFDPANGQLARQAGPIPREGKRCVVGEAFDRTHLAARYLAPPRHHLQRRLTLHDAIDELLHRGRLILCRHALTSGAEPAEYSF